MLNLIQALGRHQIGRRQLGRRCLAVLPDKSTTLEKFSFAQHTHCIGQISAAPDKYIGQEITLFGWINGPPRKVSRKLVFAGFRDFNSDRTQIVAKDEALSQRLRAAKPEDAISVTGIVGHKQNKDGSFSWELAVQRFQVLNSADVRTSQLESLNETPSLYPPEYRYLQLRHQYYQQALKMRAHAARVARSVLDEHHFTEIETPLLFKSTPEGANEFLVPTRRNGLFYALPQSPQQYKQLLMASGFKGYYQIAKCFRDEDLRADRQPEFTQIDLEMSFAQAEDVQRVVQNLVESIFRDVRRVPLYKAVGDNELHELSNGEPLPQLTYTDALAKYGIDKPDLRSSLRFSDVSSFFASPTNSQFPVIEACVLPGALEQRPLPDALFDRAEYKSRRPLIFKIKDAEMLQNWHEKLPLELAGSVEELNTALGVSVGDIVAISDRAELSYENPTPLGRFRQLAIQHFPTRWRRKVVGGAQPRSEDVFVASWVVGFPLFSPVEIENEVNSSYPLYDFEKFESTHHPFTMANLNDYENLSVDPLSVRGDHYDLVVNGVELGGGSRRIHDAQLQRFIFTQILGIKDPDVLFGHLLAALDSGCPPHAGLAIGFDRLCSMLLGSSNIRDVVAFPKTQTGSDPVVQSPSEVSDESLAGYHIRRIGEDN